jgi:hypothetical protein
VILPIIEYRTKGIYLPPTSAQSLNSPLKQMFRSKANLSIVTGYKIIEHPDFYGIPTVADI